MGEEDIVLYKYVITTIADVFEFTGKHRKDLETQNWHYYETYNGHLLHFRKEHMVVVESWEVK